MNDTENVLVLVGQIGGFVGAVLATALHYFGFNVPFCLPLVAMGIHFASDVVFITENTTLSFNIDNYLKLPAWLTFVGLAICVITLDVSHAHTLTKAIGSVGAFISLAGQLYDKIYP